MRFKSLQLILCTSTVLFILSLLHVGCKKTETESGQSSPDFPVQPEVFVDSSAFRSAEGIAFNGENRLFVTANRALWEISPDAERRKVINLNIPIGIAPIGTRDLLVADFGPTNQLSGERNIDGLIYRITPEGEIDTLSTAIPDPNFITVMDDGKILVADDFDNKIWEIDQEGKTSIFTTLVDHPNGLALHSDNRFLYVAQTFSSINPIKFDNRVWRIVLDEEGLPDRAEVIFRTGETGGNDGLAIDSDGFLYIAANREGKLWRYDPDSREAILITDNVPGIASVAVGRGEYNSDFIYATQLGVGTVWKIRIKK